MRKFQSKNSLKVQAKLNVEEQARSRPKDSGRYGYCDVATRSRVSASFAVQEQLLNWNQNWFCIEDLSCSHSKAESRIKPKYSNCSTSFFCLLRTVHSSSPYLLQFTAPYLVTDRLLFFLVERD